MGARYLNVVRSQIIGRDLLFETPFGLRNMFYADYTASGRGLRFIEDLLSTSRGLMSIPIQRMIIPGNT